MTDEANEGLQARNRSVEFQAIGSFCRMEELDTDFQKQPGLVWITVEGENLCPMTQFTYDSNGFAALRPELSHAWEASRALDAQFGLDEVTTLLRFDTERPQLSGRTWWQVLTSDEEDETVKQLVLHDLLDDAQSRVSHKDDDIVITDPRSDLPKL